MDRNDIGFLVWESDKDQTELLKLGSRYKTPVLPIWVTCINNNWGVLFNPREDLMKSHSAENRCLSVEIPDTWLRLDLFSDSICTTTVTQ